MSNFILRVSIWVLGIISLVGNTVVIIWRYKDARDSKVSHTSFIPPVTSMYNPLNSEPGRHFLDLQSRLPSVRTRNPTWAHNAVIHTASRSRNTQPQGGETSRIDGALLPGGGYSVRSSSKVHLI